MADAAYLYYVTDDVIDAPCLSYLVDAAYLWYVADDAVCDM
jgi:hypothetical protein